MLTYREQRIWDDIAGQRKGLGNMQLSDFQHLYDQWIEGIVNKIPIRKREVFFQGLDKALFELHSFIQSSSFQRESKKRIIDRAKVFEERIESLHDLKTLPIDRLIYLADSEIAKHRIYSLAQGGVTGLGGFVLLFSDLPMMAAINLRITQVIGMCYGYDANVPYEMMLSLKVFHAGTLPQRLQGYAWDELVKEVREREDEYFYLGTEALTDYTWLEQPLKQILKLMLISNLRKKVIQGVPILGIGIGSITNYQLTKQVTEFAHRFYQYRFLYEKNKYPDKI